MSLTSKKSLRWLLTAIALFLVHTTAYAQATRTWVSGVGDDANPCSRTAPCKTFAGAISKTASGGEIDTLDPGGFGAVTITKAITIQSDDSKNGGILVAGTNGITINITSGLPTDIVTIRGVAFNGLGAGSPTSTPGLNGIKFLAGAALIVENCYISGFTTSGGFGILMAPSTGLSRLQISNTTINNNGDGTNGGGVGITPTGSGIVVAEIDHAHIGNNKGFGIRVDNNGFATVTASNISGSKKSGVAAFGGASGADIVLTDSVIADDGIDGTANDAGILASGATGFIHISNNVISENVTGIRQLSSGKVFTYGNNKAVANTANGIVNGGAVPQL
jgi:hypothetical protein